MINLSTGAFYERATSQIGSLRAQAIKLQEQIGSGERLGRSSEDPVAAARLRTLARTERLAEIDQTSSDRAMNDLKLTDSALGSVADLVIRAKELATSAANDTLSESQRAVIGTELASLREGLLLIANSRNGSGHALFGGQSAGAAYVDTAGVAGYAGTAMTDAVELGEGQQVIPAMTGPEVFDFEVDGVPTDLFAVLGSLSAALQAGGTGLHQAATDGIAALNAGLDKVTTSQTIVGARMSWVELMDERRETNGELRAQESETVGGADPAATLTRLNEIMTVLEASQASFVQLSGMSLFSMLR